MDRVRHWWSGRSRREQGLLAMLALIVALAVGWYGVVIPITSWRDAAAARHAAAASDHAMVVSALGQGGGPGTAPAELERRVRAAAEPHALVLEAVEPDGDDGVTVAIDSVASAQLFAWISALEGEHGLVIRDFTVLENADATLQAQLGIAGSGR